MAVPLLVESTYGRTFLSVDDTAPNAALCDLPGKFLEKHCRREKPTYQSRATSKQAFYLGQNQSSLSKAPVNSQRKDANHDAYKTKSNRVVPNQHGGCFRLFPIWSGSNKGRGTTTADIVALVDTVFKAFNGKDFALLKSVYGGNLVIIDGFGRYRWTGSNALDEWWSDAEKWAKDGGVASEELSSQGIRAWGVSGDRAYVSISATLTIKLNRGEPIIRPGILTFTLAKLGDVWKAEGHACQGAVHT